MKLIVLGLISLLASATESTSSSPLVWPNDFLDLANSRSSITRNSIRNRNRRSSSQFHEWTDCSWVGASSYQATCPANKLIKRACSIYGNSVECRQNNNAPVYRNLLECCKLKNNELTIEFWGSYQNQLVKGDTGQFITCTSYSDRYVKTLCVSGSHRQCGQMSYSIDCVPLADGFDLDYGDVQYMNVQKRADMGGSSQEMLKSVM